MSRDDQLAAFGRAIRQARVARGWSMQELGRRIGRNRSFVSVLEAGGSGASAETVTALEDALDLTGQLGWIIGHGPPPDIPTIELVIEIDPTLSDDERRILLATLAEIRRIGSERDQEHDQ